MGIIRNFLPNSLSLCLRFLAWTSPHLQNSLTHYTISTRSSVSPRSRFSLRIFLTKSWLPMDIRCPVSCKFPHGTFHYQSHTVSFVMSRWSYFLPSAFHVRMYWWHDPSSTSDWILHTIYEISLVSTRPPNFARHYSRDLGWFIWLVLRCFNSQLFCTFFRMLLHSWNLILNWQSRLRVVPNIHPI